MQFNFLPIRLCLITSTHTPYNNAKIVSTVVCSVGESYF